MAGMINILIEAEFQVHVSNSLLLIEVTKKNNCESDHDKYLLPTSNKLGNTSIRMT